MPSVWTTGKVRRLDAATCGAVSGQPDQVVWCLTVRDTADLSELQCNPGGLTRVLTGCVAVVSRAEVRMLERIAFCMECLDSDSVSRGWDRVPPSSLPFVPLFPELRS